MWPWKKKKLEVSKKKVLKVIYFDENTAGDYLNISAGGSKDIYSEEGITKEISTEKSAEIKIAFSHSFMALAGVVGLLTFSDTTLKTISGCIAILVILSKVFPYIFSYIKKETEDSKSLIQTQIKSTILTEFINSAQNNNKIPSFEEYELEIDPKSFTFMKFYEPLLKIVKLDVENIDITKLGEVMASIKGYYELVASKNGEKVILRLNADAFRNNYKLTDLIQMKLKYFGICVGKMAESKMGFFNAIPTQKEVSSPYEEILKAEQKSETSPENTTEYDVIDVILACVEG